MTPAHCAWARRTCHQCTQASACVSWGLPLMKHLHTALSLYQSTACMTSTSTCPSPASFLRTPEFGMCH